MGYIRHRAVLAVISNDNIETKNNKKINSFIDELNKKIEAEGIPALIIASDITVNNYRSYIFFPDGSKLGWGTSDNIEKLRIEFRKKMESFGANVISISFGGDDDEITTLTDCRGNYHSLGEIER